MLRSDADYDANAEVHVPEACRYPLDMRKGCMIRGALNYDPLALQVCGLPAISTHLPGSSPSPPQPNPPSLTPPPSTLSTSTERPMRVQHAGVHVVDSIQLPPSRDDG